MSSVQDSGAAALLSRAVQLDNEHCYQEALSCYQSGIAQLLQVVKESRDDQLKSRLKTRMLEYMDRAEKIKECILNQRDDCKEEKYHEQIRIEYNSSGHCYADIFGRLLDPTVTQVEVDDAYIRSVHQIYNFLRFCEMLLTSKAAVKRICLTTGLGEGDSHQVQMKQLSELSISLQQHGVELVVEYSDTLHDREIRFNNGWVVQIGRGLDIFKAPDSKFSIGFCDMKLRRCHETTINIFHRKHTRTLSRFEPINIAK